MDTLIDQLKGLEDGARAMYGVSTKWNSQDNANAVETAAVYHYAATDIRKMSNPKVYDALMSFYEDVSGCQDVQTYAQYVCKKVKDYVYEALENFKKKKSVTPVTDRASGRIAKVMDTLIDQLKGLEDGARAMYGVSTKWNSQDNANAVETAAVYHYAATDIRKMSNPKVYDALMSFYEDVSGCQDVQTYAQYVCKKVKDYAYEALENFKTKKQ